MRRTALLPERVSILGSGWLGLPLAVRLVKAGLRVKASTTSTERLSEIEATGSDPYILNINKISYITRKFLDSDTLIINIPSRDVESFGELVDEIGLSPIRNVLYVSSTSVYQNSNSPITESDGLEITTNPFFIIENLFRASRRFRTTVVRFAGLIGKDRHPGRFFAGGRPVPNPEGVVNMIHLDDCIGLIMRILEQSAWGEVFNGCADSHPTRREFYASAARSLGLSEPVFADNGLRELKIVSNQKAKQVLGYTFRHPDLMAIDFA